MPKISEENEAEAIRLFTADHPKLPMSGATWEQTPDHIRDLYRAVVES